MEMTMVWSAFIPEDCCSQTSCSPPRKRRKPSCKIAPHQGSRTRSWWPYFLQSCKRRPAVINDFFVLKKARKTKQSKMASADLWTQEIENTFLQLLVQSVNAGGILNGHIGKDTWPELLTLLMEMTDREWTMDQLWSKVPRLKQDYREFTDLLRHETGFVWDPISNTVDGIEAQWQNYLRVNRKASRFRNKGCPNYELLGSIFSPGTATGVLRRSSAQDTPDSDDEQRLIELLHQGVMKLGQGGLHIGDGGSRRRPALVDVVDLDDMSPIGGFDEGYMGTGKGKQPYIDKRKGKGKGKSRGGDSDISMGMSTKLKRSKSSNDEDLTTMLRSMIDVARARRKMLFVQTNQVMSATNGSSTGTSVDPTTKCIELLNELGADMDDDKYLRAVNLLMDDKFQKAFQKMPVERRKKAWLDRV